MSTSSTAKKRKTSWEVLLKNVKDCPEDVNLQRLLIDEDPDAFCVLPERCQRAILKDLLGDGSDLVDSVMKSIKKTTQSPQTEVDKLLSHTLAPSASQHMNDDTLLDVGEALLKPTEGFEEVRKMRNYLFPSGEPSLESESICIPEELSKDLLADYSFYERNLRGLRSKEITGVPLLAKFVGCVTEILNKLDKGKFKSELELSVIDSTNPGKNSTTNGAVVVIHTPSTLRLQPVILYEYKPVVYSKPQGVNARHLTELLIQGFYCFHSYKIRVCLLCLTDLHNWHYFKAKAAASCMEIEWAKSMEETTTIPDLSTIQTHLSFVAAAVDREIVS